MRRAGLSVYLFVFFLLCGILSSTYAGGWEGRVHLISKTNNDFSLRKDTEKIPKKRNAIFNLDVDLQLGVDIAKTTNELNVVDSNTNSLQNTNTKVGPSVGAIVNFDFLGFGFSSGLQYSSKGFETTNGDKTGLNFLNIPLLLYFGFEAGKIRVDGNFGPYFGLLVSQDETSYYKVKNFDFGLTGNISMAYMFSKYVGALLGGKYEYGGLNNLQSNEFIKKTTTSTIFIFTGLKFEI